MLTHFEYEYVIDVLSFKVLFPNKTESVRLYVTLAIYDGIKNFSRNKLCQKLELQYLDKIRWIR